MSAIGIWAEVSEGRFKKPVLEALTAGRSFADREGLPLWAIVVSGETIPDNLLQTLADYGADKVILITHGDLQAFISNAYARVLAQYVKEAGLSFFFLPQSYNGRAVAPLLSIWADAAFLSGINAIPEKEGAGYKARRIAYSNKAIEWIYTEHKPIVATLRPNSFVPAKASRPLQVEVRTIAPLPEDLRARPVKVEKVATDRVPLTEAEIVVSGGRGLKGPENWGIIEDLAKVLGAATACSKPVADVGWRPHHEHVGQTGIQISPNLYIAVGVSGAIQHLAGVASSKNIVVINNDPEAPFFKVADYGIVGDAFEVVPRLNEAIRRYKEQHSH
jgi:Electron transfer flavoprotein, alpha subunit